jgi:hypothetical protein
MGILYGWTKEYLLQEMSFSQIVMYMNEGIRFKYPQPKQPKSDGASLVGAPADEIRARRDKLREQYGQNIGRE